MRAINKEISTRMRNSNIKIVLGEKFFQDKRFSLLSMHTGEPESIVRWRVIELWRDCFIRQSDLMTWEEVDISVRWNGTVPFAELMARSSLAEKVGTQYRVRGVKERTAREKKSTDTFASSTSLFIKTYCASFKKRWGTNPQLTKIDAGIAQRLIKSISVERAIDLIDTYLSMNDPFFLRARHNLLTFERSLNAIAIAHDTGKTLGTAEIRSLDRHESLAAWVNAAEKP